jgi:hypothetical protein
LTVGSKQPAVGSQQSTVSSESGMHQSYVSIITDFVN